MLWLLISPFGLWWWAFLVGFCVCATIAAENDDWFGETWVWIVMYLAMMGFFSEVGGALNYIRLNPRTIILGVIGYICIGVFYGWFWFRVVELVRVKRKVQELREKFNNLKSKKYTNFESYCDSEGFECQNFSDYGPRIVKRMAYWPFSSFYLLLNDCCRQVFQTIYNLTSGIFKRTYDHQMTKIKKILEFDKVDEITEENVKKHVNMSK